jgi:hypothetical protein
MRRTRAPSAAKVNGFERSATPGSTVVMDDRIARAAAGEQGPQTATPVDRRRRERQLLWPSLSDALRHHQIAGSIIRADRMSSARSETCLE